MWYLVTPIPIQPFLWRARHLKEPSLMAAGSIGRCHRHSILSTDVHARISHMCGNHGASPTLHTNHQPRMKSSRHSLGSDKTQVGSNKPVLVRKAHSSCSQVTHPCSARDSKRGHLSMASPFHDHAVGITHPSMASQVSSQQEQHSISVNQSFQRLDFWQKLQ